MNKSINFLLLALQALEIGIETEVAWFNRNYQLSRKLKPDPIGFKILAEHLSEHLSDTDRIFECLATGNSRFFVRKGGTQVMLVNMSGFN